MPERRAPRLSLPALACGVLAMVAMSSAWAAETAGSLRPFLTKHCYDCHGEDTQKAGLRLDTLAPQFGDAENFDRWAEVYERVAAGEMPPAKRKKQPAPAERAAFAAALKQTLLASEQQRRGTEGAVLRRLNRVEYENTIHDLLGIDEDLKDLLPTDGSAQGFDNNGEALSMSSVLLERYLEAADTALDAVFVKGPRPETKKWHVTLQPPNVKENDFRLNGASRILPDGTVVFFNSQLFQPIQVEQFHAPVAGRYRFRISQYAYQSPGKGLAVAWYGGSFGGKSKSPHLIGHFDVPAGEPTVIEFVEKMPVRGTLKPMPYRLGTRAPKDTTGYQGPGVAVQWVEIEGPLIDSWPPAGYQRLMGGVSLEKGTLADAETVLRNLAPRAFRRPITDEDLAPYLGLVRQALKAGKPFEEALRDGIKGVLCAPDFLYLREPAGKLDDFALATRLSYFLWSSLPDDTLMEAARKGTLRSAGGLHAQVERMLDDPKSQRFVENFTGQWLGLRNIDATTPDKKLHPDFDEALQDAMVRETHLFFTELLQHDLSVRNFVQSDFAMLNSRLAELYGIAGVSGWQFRKVALPPGSHRGGVLCQASILKITANGTTTSPVIRGNWVLKNILGRPVKPPPPNVPALEPDVRGATTIRQQVAQHRANASCALCHDRIDPPGLALENFDIIGQWRTNYRVPQMSSDNPQNELRLVSYKPGAPVDPTGELPGGRKFANIDELKQLLLADGDQVARCVAEKLLTYATGANLTFTDKMVIQDFLQETAAKDHGLRSLVHAVVASDSFQNK